MKMLLKLLVVVGTREVVFFHTVSQFHLDLPIVSEDLEVETIFQDYPDDFFINRGCLHYKHNPHTKRIEKRDVKDVSDFLLMRHLQCCMLDHLHVVINTSLENNIGKVRGRDAILFIKEQEAKDYIAGTNIDPKFLTIDFECILQENTTISLLDVANLAILQANEYRALLLTTHAIYMQWSTTIKRCKSLIEANNTHKQLLAEVQVLW